MSQINETLQDIWRIYEKCKQRGEDARVRLETRSPGLEYKDINPDSDPEDIQSFNHQQEILNSDIQESICTQNQGIAENEDDNTENEDEDDRTADEDEDDRTAVEEEYDRQADEDEKKIEREEEENIIEKDCQENGTKSTRNLTDESLQNDEDEDNDEEDWTDDLVGGESSNDKTVTGKGTTNFKFG